MTRAVRCVILVLVT